MYPAEHFDAEAAGGPVHDVHDGGGLPARRAADRHRDRWRVRPTERGGPAGQHVRGVPAQQRVDERGLQPRVPGTAALRGPRIDPGRRERDLAGELQYRFP